ncbi:MAG: hypothetical protein AB1810_00645 [Pseudomonadota bacterium]
MNALIENQFTNLGAVTRVSHILLAKAVTVVTAYGAVAFGGFVSSAWFVFPVLLAAYLLFTGTTGWDPLTAIDKRLNARRQRARMRRIALA